jgi:hypothetical protein
MKILKASLKFLVLFASIVVLFSCTKSGTENKLLGTWKWINLADINDSTNVEKWQFSADGKMKVFIDVNGIPDTVPNAVLLYKVKSYKKVEFLPSDSSPDNDYCHEWEITKLKNDIMILNREAGGLETKEFVKL